MIDEKEVIYDEIHCIRVDSKHFFLPKNEAGNIFISVNLPNHMNIWMIFSLKDNSLWGFLEYKIQAPSRISVLANFSGFRMEFLYPQKPPTQEIPSTMNNKRYKGFHESYEGRATTRRGSWTWTSSFGSRRASQSPSASGPLPARESLQGALPLRTGFCTIETH